MPRNLRVVSLRGCGQRWYQVGLDSAEVWLIYIFFWVMSQGSSVSVDELK